jgi:hypothetical protein
MMEFYKPPREGEAQFAPDPKSFGGATLKKLRMNWSES